MSTRFRRNPERRSALRFALALLLVPGVVLAGALTVRARSGLADPSPAAPPLVTIQAHDFGFAVPATVPAGLARVRLVNRGALPHHAVLTRLAPGMTGDAFLEAIEGWFQGGPEPEGFDDPGSPGVVMPGDSTDVLVRLAPGHYLVTCFMDGPDGVMHFLKGMRTEFDVVAPVVPRATQTPAPDTTIELMDYTFRLSAPLTAAAQVIRVVSRGPQEHEVQLARVLPGHSAEEARAWLTGGMQGPPPLVFAGGLVDLSAGDEGWLPITLTPGAYVLLCLVPDAVDRKPHMAHGMVYAVRVS
ncbi:MAG TPA: hypothetical protein VKA44_04630 [Gemmatimonadota bacterium]|nr:hypothetical protein [Gemmatimonadota bacterium]